MRAHDSRWESLRAHESFRPYESEQWTLNNSNPRLAWTLCRVVESGLSSTIVKCGPNERKLYMTVGTKLTWFEFDESARESLRVHESWWCSSLILSWSGVKQCFDFEVEQHYSLMDRALPTYGVLRLVTTVVKCCLWLFPGTQSVCVK